MSAQAEALFFEGNRLMRAGDYAPAEECFRRSVEIAPDFAEGHANLGFLLGKRGDAEGAKACYRRCLEINSGFSEIHLNLGAILSSEKKFDEAEIEYRQAIALRPDAPAGWSNLGVLYACMRRESEAERCYRTAMALDGSYANARFNLSYLLLRQGNFEEGWRCFESRDWYAPLAAYFSCPRWHGESLAGKSLLIGYEGGHGDMIQFCRYVAVLKKRGASSIALMCPPALKTLLATLEGVNSVISLVEPIPSSGWDFWTPLLSLPYYCETRMGFIPDAIPYLRACPDAAEKWAALLPKQGFRVGLVWKGNPLHENDADRSLPSLDVLAPLWRIPGVFFVSLQKGAGEEEAVNSPFPLIAVGHRMENFSDAAAALMNLDLVICVDTAMAHLAGALGKPCWVLLPYYKKDWRWLKRRADSPWYPGVMRLYRQSCMGNWANVIAEVAVSLKEVSRGSKSG